MHKTRIAAISQFLWRKLHRVAVAAFTVVLTLAIYISFTNTTSSEVPRDYYEQVTNLDHSKGAADLKAGIFVQRLYNFDPESKTFWANGYFWIKWKDPIKAYNTTKTGEGKPEDLNTTSLTNPMGKVEFLNAVETDDMSRVSWPEKPYRTEDGWLYQSITFSGKFVATDVNYSRFPFETLELPIEIETDGFWITEVIFSLDDKESQGLASNNSLQGFRYTNSSFITRKHVYSTSFGLNADAKKIFGHKNKSIYPNFLATFKYQREPGSTSWQLFVPLSAVILVTVVSPLIDPKNSEPKVALPASVILALVFLQQGYREMLPRAISYLTYMDKIYSVAYIATVIVFIFAVYSTNTYLRGEASPKKVLFIRQLEKRLCAALVVFLVISPYFAWQ